MKMRHMIRLLSKRDLEQVLTLGEMIEVVEEGFAADVTDEITIFPVAMEHITAHSAFFGIKQLDSGTLRRDPAGWRKPEICSPSLMVT